MRGTDTDNPDGDARNLANPTPATATSARPRVEEKRAIR
jgi:hypothetical protein